MSSSHLFFGLPNGRIDVGFHLYDFFNILSSCIPCKWPNQFIRYVICDLIYSYVLLIHLIYRLF